MKRRDALNWIQVAGYHGDKAAFTRLLIENRVGRTAADAAYASGVKAKSAGMPCSCTECRRVQP